MGVKETLRTAVLASRALWDVIDESQRQARLQENVLDKMGHVLPAAEKDRIARFMRRLDLIAIECADWLDACCPMKAPGGGPWTSWARQIRKQADERE